MSAFSHRNRAATIALLALSGLIAGAPAAAQTKQSASLPKPSAASSGCAYSPTAAWVVRQSTFFDDSKHDWSDDTLRTALLKAAGLGATLSSPVNVGVQIEGSTAPLGPSGQAMIESLKALGAVRGSTWPTRSVVGAAGTHAVYLLSQHDTTLGRVALHRMMEAGPTESPAIDVAVFEDHMRMLWGRKQIYGTQFERNGGKIVLAPMEDSSHADLRREGASLPPFKLGLCFAQKM